MKKAIQAIFVTLIFILATIQSAYAIGDSFTYDANGNMVQGPGGLYYEYNDANQLKRIRDGSTTGPIIAEYWYDHTGKRIKKNESGVVTYYWSKSFEQKVYPNGTVVNTTYYFANGERLAKNATTDSGSKMYYFHPDHLGSTSVVADENGQLVEKTKYYPYGKVKQGGSEQYLFTGKERDKGTGLYYYGARYYNPELMRFTQPDTLIQDAYDPQSLNRYAYVGNNPLKYVDPSGNRKIKTDMNIGPDGLGGRKVEIREVQDPQSQLTESRHYNKLQYRSAEHVANYWLEAVGISIVSNEGAKKLKVQKKATQVSLISSALNPSEEYAFHAGLFVRSMKDKSGDYSEVDGWIGDQDGEQYGSFTYNTLMNYHSDNTQSSWSSSGSSSYYDNWDWYYDYYDNYWDEDYDWCYDE